MPDLAGIPAWGIFSIAIVFMVLQFLQRWEKAKSSKSPVTLEAKSEKQLSDLWDWHNVVDPDGVRVWYIRNDLRHAMEAQTEILRKLTTLQTHLLEHSTETRRVMKVMESLVLRLEPALRSQ